MTGSEHGSLRSLDLVDPMECNISSRVVLMTTTMSVQQVISMPVHCTLIFPCPSLLLTLVYSDSCLCVFLVSSCFCPFKSPKPRCGRHSLSFGLSSLLSYLSLLLKALLSMKAPMVSVRRLQSPILLQFNQSTTAVISRVKPPSSTSSEMATP